MKTLSTSLSNNQLRPDAEPLYKLYLSKDSTEYTYKRERIRNISHTEEEYNQSAQVMLDNKDKALIGVDIKYYEGVISLGYMHNMTEEYVDYAPLYVSNFLNITVNNKLYTYVSLIGIMNLMDKDKASDTYQPDENDTNTVQDLFLAVCGATLDVFTGFTAWEVVVDSSDSLFTTYMPKDGFFINKNQSRLSVIKALMGYTKCVVHVKADGKIHVSNPTVSGSTYDKLFTQSGHNFGIKGNRSGLVTPNRIVVASAESHVEQYSGSATYTADNDLVDNPEYYTMRLSSNDEADNLATAILQKYKVDSESGYVEVPMDLESEVHDYDIITDLVAGDNTTGNIKQLIRTVDSDNKDFKMSLRFGVMTDFPASWLMRAGLTGDYINNQNIYQTVQEIQDTVMKELTKVDQRLKVLEKNQVIILTSLNALKSGLALIVKRLWVTECLRIPVGEDKFHWET